MPEADPPCWVDAGFVQEALKRSGGNDADVMVTSISTKPVGVDGDNFGSTMCRITAETTNGVRSIISKTLPPGDVFKETVKKSNIFGVERLVLGDIVPKMHELLEDAAPGRFPPLAARCLHHGDEPEDFLVLEDLGPQGFRLADRHRGLGLRHSLLALRTIARFHAASVPVLAQNPTLPNQLPSLHRKLPREQFEPLLFSTIQTTADAIREWPDFPSHYADSLEEIKPKLYQKFTSINDFHPGRFNVLLHGDFWINNMMFRYDDEQVVDVRLVDLQLSRVTSPAIDLLHFLYTSVSEDVSKHHADFLIREYHVALAETMQLLGLEAPTLKEIVSDIEEFGVWSISSGLCVLPMVKSEKAPDMEKSISNDDDEKKYMYTSSTIKRWLQRLIPEFARKGLFTLKAMEC